MYLTVPAWDRFDGLVHAFFGAEILPVGVGRATTMAAARSALALPPSAPLYLPDQVHGDRLVVAKSGTVGEADGVIVLGPGRFAGVVTADCCPVLLIAPTAHAAAAVHAGWRGTAAAIVAKAVTRLCETASVTPTDLHAAIGPAIGACCYEVGEEVVAALGALGDAGRAAIQRHTGRRHHADLRAINRALLIKAGMPPQQVQITGGCTACDTAFPCHSFRRDQADAGRQLSLVGWRG